MWARLEEGREVSDTDMCSVAVEGEGRELVHMCSCCRIVDCMCRLNGREQWSGHKLQRAKGTYFTFVFNVAR